MKIIRTILAPLLALALLGGCATQPDGPPPAAAREVAALAASIRALGPEVDPAEAERAAQVAYAETARLARAYGITDPPLIHNAKVNLGLRPRGLCWHWADDLGARMRAESFRTLDLHQAVANADNPFRLEHSTLVVSARGDSLFEGVVLDPWRMGGVLHWAPTRADTDYAWRPLEEVMERKRRRTVRAGFAPAG